MVNPTDSTESQIYRTAHFLRPLLPSSNQPPPPPPPQEQNSAACNRYKDLPFQMNFRGVRIVTKKWVTWVYKMCSLHEKIWKKAGIFDAIMSSIYIIHIEDELIFGFSEKWCPSTNSFVFPWGEATVTLEDVMILGGFYVTGDSILSPVSKDSEMGEALDRLHSVRQTLNRSKARKARQHDWMKKFMKESSSENEHEAFLILWLSRFVFPVNSERAVCKDVFSIAVRLARGVKIALAPAVLASIYQSLSLLKSTLIAARRLVEYGGDDSSVLEVVISAPLALFQVWVFERFPSLRLKPNYIRENEPRMARWQKMKKVDSAIHSVAAAGNFDWRPYMRNRVGSGDAFTRKIYKDYEYWVVVDDETEVDEELEVLVRCLRTSELVGLEPDCIEQYLPHRVAMQFGMDQDIPCHVERANGNTNVAWSSYNRPIFDERLYVPSSLFEPGVTARYLEWWKQDEDLIPISKLFGYKRNVNIGLSQEVGKRQKNPSTSTSNGADNGSYGKRGFKSSFKIPRSASKSKRNIAEEFSRDSTTNLSSKEADHELKSTTDEFLEGFEERVGTLEKLFSLFKQGQLDYLLANHPNIPQG